MNAKKMRELKHTCALRKIPEAGRKKWNSTDVFNPRGGRSIAISALAQTWQKQDYSQVSRERLCNRDLFYSLPRPNRVR